jgi:serine/threonine protein phosphatase 1
VGDVHGQLDLFEALFEAIAARAAQTPKGPRHLITLGDYVDRGEGSIAVLDRLRGLAIPGVAVTRLLGNHEQFLAEFLFEESADEAFLDFWAMNGGLDTLKGLGATRADIRRLGPPAVIAQARADAPAWIGELLDDLEIGLRLGDYLFIHAGVHPRLPLQDPGQRPTTIREPFLSGEGWIHDFAVVHGHTIAGPAVAPHRIAVDSGAFMTGVLTAVELCEDRARFLCASREANLDALARIPGRRPLSAERWRPFEPA